MEGWLAGHTDGRRKAAPMREKSSPAGSAAGHSSKALASMARRRREAPRGRCHFLNEAKFDALEGTEALDVFRQDIVNGLAGFAPEDCAVGQETLTESVLGRPELSAGSFGAIGARSAKQ